MAWPARFDVRDLGLADGGAERIEAGARRLPVLRAVREQFLRERPLAGYRLSACLDVDVATASLVRTLAAAGVDQVLCAASAMSTEDDVAAALVAEDEIPVLAVGGEDPERYYAHLETVCDHRPQLVIDTGGDLIGLLHAARREQLGHVLAGVVGAATGVVRAETLAAEGVLAFPVVDARDARTVRLHEEREEEEAGATLGRITRDANLYLPGARVAVVGYGRRGRPLAARARELGARVVVAEVEPVRALEATLDGFEVGPLREALAGCDLVVVATARRNAVSRRDADRLADGAVVAPLDRRAAAIEIASPAGSLDPGATDTPVEVVTLDDGRAVRIARPGRGGPTRSPEVDDVRLAAVALAVEHLAAVTALPRRVHPVPPAVDARVASLKLAALGVEPGAAPGAGEAAA